MENDADTVRQALRQAATRIEPSEAELLLGHALRRPRSWLFAHGDDLLAGDARAAFEAMVARRVAGEPVAYITGSRGFWTLELAVTPDVLVPRPESELLVELALARIAMEKEACVLDLGTGSGAVALAIAKERPRAQVTATDASRAALAVAEGNARRNHIGNVRFVHGDWYAPLGDARFDVIVSNPPYVAEGDPHLREGDLRFEPALALSCGSDGLAAIRAIVAGAPARLHPGGWLLIEHGWEQGAAVREMLREAGFVEVATARDLEQRERVSHGCLGAASG